MNIIKIPFFIMLVISMLGLGIVPSFANGQSGTTLAATVDATWAWTQEFPWCIDKSVSPSNWDLFQGDTGTSRYTIDVKKGDPIESRHLNRSRNDIIKIPISF